MGLRSICSRIGLMLPREWREFAQGEDWCPIAACSAATPTPTMWPFTGAPWRHSSRRETLPVSLIFDWTTFAQ
jgi:hypothetical protein